MVIPERIIQNGSLYYSRENFIKHSNEGRRTKTLFYRLVAFGSIFVFHLKEQRGLLAPKFVLEHVFNRTHRVPNAEDLDQCVYGGKVSGDPVSTAIFNLCHGLVSLLCLL